MARPRSFDDMAVLDAALGCFWGRGYEATSIRHLTEAMRIGGPSLYNAFGDKRSLYAETLEHYCRTRTYPLLERLEREHTGAAGIAAFFGEIITRSLADRERRGCFLINSAIDVAPHDAELAEVVNRHLGAIRAFLARSLRAARQAGAANLDLEGAADHLLAVLLGIRVLARSKPNLALLEGIVRTALAPLGLTSTIDSAVTSTANKRGRTDTLLKTPRSRRKPTAN